jgi:membrane protein required for colicin V production
MPDGTPIALLDWVLLAVLALSTLIGLWRGLVFELLSLAAWLLAWLAAQWWSPAVAQWLGTAHTAPAFALTFVAALIAGGLLARLARLLVAATPLRLVDRLLGAGFGFLRGLLILLVAASLLALTPAARSPAWRASRGAGGLQALVEMLKPLWPASAAAAPSGA